MQSPTLSDPLTEQVQTDAFPLCVGLDLSLTGTGIAVVSDTVSGLRITTDLISSKGKKADSLLDRAARLSSLRDRIVQRIPADTLVVVEQPAYSQTGGSHHDRSGLWWLVVAWLHDLCDVVEVTPGTVKKYATGKGNAGKYAMYDAARRRYPDVAITDDNVADAVHLAALGCRWLGHPMEDETVKMREALAAVRWAA